MTAVASLMANAYLLVLNIRPMRNLFRSVHWSDKLIDILVVVLGISIAFWLNNWNQERQNITLEQQYLKNLRGDLAKDSVNLTVGFMYMDTISFSIKRIYQLYDDRNNADSISYYFQALRNDFLSFKPEDYTYDALRQTGDINIIQNDSIARTLSQLYDTYELFQIQVELAWRYTFDLMLPYYYNRNYQVGTAYDDTIYMTPKFQTTLMFYESNLENRRGLMRKALSEIKILNQLIELQPKE